MLRAIPSGSQYQMFLDVLAWIGNFMQTLFNLPLPWFNLTFGEVLLGPIFIFVLYGVFKIIFAGIGNSVHGGGTHD